MWPVSSRDSAPAPGPVPGGAQLWGSAAAGGGGSQERPTGSRWKATMVDGPAVIPVTCGSPGPALRASQHLPEGRPPSGCRHRTRDSRPQPQAITTGCPHTTSSSRMPPAITSRCQRGGPRHPDLWPDATLDTPVRVTREGDWRLNGRAQSTAEPLGQAGPQAGS